MEPGTPAPGLRVADSAVLGVRHDTTLRVVVEARTGGARSLLNLHELIEACHTAHRQGGSGGVHSCEGARRGLPWAWCNGPYALRVMPLIAARLLGPCSFLCSYAGGGNASAKDPALRALPTSVAFVSIGATWATQAACMLTMPPRLTARITCQPICTQIADCALASCRLPCRLHGGAFCGCVVPRAGRRGLQQLAQGRQRRTKASWHAPGARRRSSCAVSTRVRGRTRGRDRERGLHAAGALRSPRGCRPRRRWCYWGGRDTGRGRICRGGAAAGGAGKQLLHSAA